jgi:hypothetical protein
VNLLSAIKEQYEKLKNEPDGADRAIALCWVFHLVGDAHQPLHTTTLVTGERSNGDLGGTKFFIRARRDSEIISLHHFWDDLIIGTQRFRSVHNLATTLIHRPGFAREKLPELEETAFENWVRVESFKLAKEVAYQDGKLMGPPEKTDNNVPVLPEGYTTKAKAVAERQIVLAGYRLAELLKKAVD